MKEGTVYLFSASVLGLRKCLGSFPCYPVHPHANSTNTPAGCGFSNFKALSGCSAEGRMVLSDHVIY